MVDVAQSPYPTILKSGYATVPIHVATDACASRPSIYMAFSRGLGERRYGRKYGCDPVTLAAGRGAHLHANWSFSPPPTVMAMKLPRLVTTSLEEKRWP